MGVMKKLPFRIRIFEAEFTRSGLLLSFGILLVGLGIIFFEFRSLAFPLAVRFNDMQGVLRFGARSEIFGVWFAFLSLWILNAVLSELFFLRERFIAYALVGLNVFLSLALLVSIFSILLMN